MFKKGDVVKVVSTGEMLDNKFVKGDIILEMMIMMAGEMLGNSEILLTVDSVEAFNDSGISFVKFAEDPDLELPDFCIVHAEPKPVANTHDCQCKPKVPFDVACDLDAITASGIHDNLFGHVHTVLSDYLDNSNKPMFPHVHTWLKSSGSNRKLFLKAVSIGYTSDGAPVKPVSFIEALAHMKDGKVATYNGIDYVAKNGEFVQYKTGLPTRLDFNMTTGQWFLK